MLNKLERKLGKVKWPSFMLILLGAYATGVLLSYVYPNSIAWICFSPAFILKGQVWRVLSFVATPSGDSLIMAMIMCFVYFTLSRSLERIIGRFKLNFFLLTGWFLTLLSGFLYHFIFTSGTLITVHLNMHYVLWTLFIIFPITYPDATFLLMFFIPIKGKWMPFITMGILSIDVVRAFLSMGPAYGWFYVFMIAAAVLNVVLFLLLLGFKIKKQPRNSTQRHYQRETRENGGAYRGNGGASESPYGRQQDAGYGSYRSTPHGARTIRPYRHKCCVCGRTDVSDPDLEFRYCSKCIGPYEYCSEHIYTHVHKSPSGSGNG